MYIGTSHFRTHLEAFRYYASYGMSRNDVQAKITAGEIHVGEPTVKPGERFAWNHEGRAVLITHD